MSNSPVRFSIFFLLSLVLSGCTPQEVLTDGSALSDESISIGYAEPLSSYSPLSYEAKNRKYLANIYEPLVRFDATFNYETALAVSWGRLDDTTWDFHIREGVTFHDGSILDADDVVYSLTLAADDEESELGALLSTIENVQKTDTYRLEITTEKPDPLLLNKLTYINIVPDAYEDFDLPIGTGPYRINQYTDNTLVLERFEEYWGPLAYFKEARLQYIADPDERTQALLDGEVHVLANVPPQSLEQLSTEAIYVEDFPSLEVSFLMLNTTGAFADPNLRTAVSYALSTSYAQNLGGGFLRGTSQLAATGITGYVSDFEPREHDFTEAEKYRALVPGEVLVMLDIPSGLESLGEAIQEDLATIDIIVTVNVMEPDAFEEKILSGLSDFYFFGWKYDLADSADFFESVVHTREAAYGEFNGMNYSNELVDLQIEEISTLLDATDRRNRLEDLSQLFLYDHAAIPLFESQVLYALSPEIYYDFRLDGLILASEIAGNMVK